MLRSTAWPLLGLVLAAGCRPQDEIARYTVPKPELIDPTLVKAQAEERQMLGAIVIVDKAGWFFKLTGAKAQVAPLAEQFVSFVKDLKFEGQPAEPQWKKMPPGWKELPGNEFRFATLEIPAGGKALELTVSTLELGEVNKQDYILANVNRWRGQIGLGELKASDLATETNRFKVSDYPCTLVEMVGTGSGAMPRGPFAGGGGPFASGDAPPLGPSTPSTSAAPGSLKFTKPEGWNDAPPKTFGIAAFTVGTDDPPMEITFSSAGGDLLMNVNRWRGQLGLRPIDAAQLAKDAKKIDTLGVQSDYVELAGSLTTSTGTSKPAMILGVAATAGGTQYFVKLTGEPGLAQRERANFEAFVKSLKFE